MLPDSTYERQLLKRHWPVADAPHGLADRIVAHATRQPQRTSFKARMARMFALPEERWHHALAYQFAALALIALLSMYAVQLNAIDDADADIDAIILDMMQDDGEL